ncbi:MAG: AAA family ATPase [Verrucomicrobiota bacterium]
MSEKQIIIIAGPNGAGKTTFAREVLPQEAHCLNFINADLIAAGLSPFAPEAAAFRAARLMLDSIKEQVQIGHSFAIESTLSGKTYARMIPEWRAAGYFVTLFFLELPSEELALERVAFRVSQGGHQVPETDVRRRFGAGRRNFLSIYKDLVDDWWHYDNSSGIPRLITSSNFDA